ncbi:hypothetical protein AMS68_006828 [Peltaster fructicola]|uniref:Vacuolar-sorting protein SNF7 n=1 Tax=Peltaster fructicola TaxID=286661 RepID=A0A6H0Y332_9PEZI|nr:hypothetical protein AMS68_006828 [Peltaster fructicola]
MSGWGFGNIWGGGSGSTAKKNDSTKDAILKLRGTLDMLSKREKHLNNQIGEQDALARKNVTTNKTVAKAALRRKKQFELHLDQTSAQIMTVEREISSIETANINRVTLDAMQNASKAMKKIHGEITIDKVDTIMEGLREQHAIGEEIAEAITQSNASNALDDDELEAELADLQQEKMDEDMLKTGTVPVSDRVSRLPNQPSGPIVSKQVEEDDEEAELRKLQQEMAM